MSGQGGQVGGRPCPGLRSTHGTAWAQQAYHAMHVKGPGTAAGSVVVSAFEALQ